MNPSMKNLRRLLYIGFVAVSACAPVGKTAQMVANQAMQNIGCKASQSEMWNSLYRIAEEGSAFPDAEDLKSALLDAGEAQRLSGANFSRYVDAFVGNYATTIDGIKAKFDPQDPQAWRKALAEMEVGIRVTDLHAELTEQITASLAKLDAAETALDAKCGVDEGAISTPLDANPASGTLWDQLKKAQITPEVYGARRVLAVAYQSCDAANLEPMTAATPKVKGITKIGTRPDGGQIRKISSVSDLNASDYYYHNLNLARSSCFNVHNDPLIYNFGGKPYATVKDQSKIDLFTRVNTGGPSLGIDCSGYVASALALGGLKMDPDPKKPLKATQIGEIPSVAFKDPQINGLRCLQKISVDAKTSILPGDIAAIKGHVIMIESIGADPLAIKNIKSGADCTSANIHPANFDFVIAQSAPIKEGIGISLIRGADYMPESKTIRDGLLAYAVAACRARFGLAANLNSPNLSIVRHAKTPECLAPKPLVMAHEDCIDSCKAL